MAYVSVADQKVILDAILPTTGTIGYVALLNGNTGSATYTVNTSTDVITLASALNLPTGTRVRSSATSAQPGINPSGTLSGSTDYYWENLSSTTGKLYASLSDAQSSTSPIDFTSTGSGTLTLTEQALTVDDDIEVLAFHELAGSYGYARYAVAATGSAIEVSGRAEKNISNVTWNITASGGDIVFKHVLFLRGGTSTIGDTTNTFKMLKTFGSNQTVADATTYNIPIRFFCQDGA